MKDLLLFLSALAVMIFGFWPMKRLDDFLEKVTTPEDENDESQ